MQRPARYARADVSSPGVMPVDAVLRQVPLFAGLADEDWSALAPRLRRTTMSRGHAVFREGESGATLYVVIDGKLKITRTAADGRENLLAVLGPGELLGELSIFDVGERTATATALTDLELAELSHHDVVAYLHDRPAVAVELLRVLAQRLRDTNAAMGDLVFTDVPGRVAKALLSLAERFGSSGPAGLLVDHGLTQEELAQLVGASRETVNKALSDFAARGWLRVEGKTVLVLDRERLARRAR